MPVKILTVTNGRYAAGSVDGGRGLPFWAGGVGVEGLYSSKSSLDSPFSLLSDSRSLALIDKLKEAKNTKTFNYGDELSWVLSNPCKYKCVKEGQSWRTCFPGD